VDLNWNNECERWHQTMLKKLKQTGRCPFRLRVYSKLGVVDWVSLDGLSDEGRARLRAMNGRFREVPPEAVLAQSDAWLASSAFFKHHGIDHDMPFEERRKRYLDILGREYKGSLQHVPPSLKSEGVFTVVKGPQFMAAHRLTFYDREMGRDGGWKIHLGKTEKESHWGGDLVPDWWETVVQ
jgi:hypothetical protein